jgi:hypothetical protein
MRKKTSTLTKLFMVSLIFFLFFGGFAMNGEKEQTGKGKVVVKEDIQSSFYLWQDDSGNSYVTIKSTQPVDPGTIYPQEPEIEFIPVDIEVPLTAEEGFQIKTYRLVQKVKKSSSIVEDNYSAIIYIIGETHLGKSQKEVAKIMCNLIKQHEIDAILLEQPDHLSYNWANFQSLEEEPEKALEVLRELMLSDSERKSEYNWGKYEKYFKDETLDIKEISERIYNDCGNEGIREVKRLIEEQSGEVKNTFDQYNKSEYVSSSDYFYIMLNLQGIKIPFHNLDSSALRENFENLFKQKKNISIKEELGPRDDYMARKAKEIIEAKGYRQVILICGALHINNFKSRFATMGYKTNIVYNSKPDLLKKELAVLVKPNYIVDLVRNSPITGSARSNEYINENEPSDDLLQVFDNFLETEGAPSLNSQQILHLRNRLMKEYHERGLKAETNWELELPIDDGRKVFFIKNSRENKIEMSLEKSVDLKRLIKLEKPGLRHYFVDFQNITQLKKINQENSDTSLTFTVEDRKSHFEVIRNGFEPVYEGNDFSQLLKVLISELSELSKQQAIYLDMKDFDEDKIELFASSLQMQKEKGDIKVLISTIPRINNSTVTRDTLLMPHQIELASKDKPKPLKIKEGEHKGWYRTTINFLLKVGDTIKQVSITIITKTREMAFRFYEILRLKISPNGFTGSLASLVNQVYREVIESSEDKEEKREIIKEFRDQSGNILFVFIRPMPGMTHQISLEKAA